MKILCLIDSLGSGGAQRQMVGLSDLLKRSGDQVKLVYYHDSHFYRFYLDEHQVESECIRCSKYKFVNLFYVLKAIRSFRPDTVISYLDGSSLLACLAKITGTKFKLIVSERSSTKHLPLTIKRRIKFFLYRRADYVVPNSYSEALYIREHYPYLKDKIRPITNYVDINHFRPIEKEKLFSNGIKIFVAGRILPSKNVLNFMRALQIVADKGFQFSVSWIGREEDREYFTQCLGEREKLGMNHIFQFKKESVNILEDYHQADVFCLPSWREGFPNVICEAMACGLPILCSDIGDNANIIQEGVNGFLFDPHSVESIAGIFIRFLQLNKNSIQQMGEESRRIALEKFSETKFIKQYLELVNSRYAKK